MISNRVLLIIHAGIYAVFAVLLFFFPDLMWPMYGLEISDHFARFLSQHNSIFLGGLAIICWLLRDVEKNTDLAPKVLKGLLWTNGLGVVITLYACITGVFSGFGWSDPVFFLLLSVLCFMQIKKNYT